MDTVEGLALADGAAFTEGIAQIFIVMQILPLVLVAILLASACHVYLCGTLRRRRAFRCPLMRREVEVEFLERWILGVRRSATPTRCSAFEAADEVACSRRCSERSFRNQWDFPVGAGGPNAGGGMRRFEAAS